MYVLHITKNHYFSQTYMTCFVLDFNKDAPSENFCGPQYCKRLLKSDIIEPHTLKKKNILKITTK